MEHAPETRKGTRGWLRTFREGFFGEGDSTIGHLPTEMEQSWSFWFLL